MTRLFLKKKHEQSLFRKMKSQREYPTQCGKWKSYARSQQIHKLNE